MTILVILPLPVQTVDVRIAGVNLRGLVKLYFDEFILVYGIAETNSLMRLAQSGFSWIMRERKPV